MIKWMRVQNFKNLADVQAEFSPLNVIIGPNGCGKTSLLQALDFVRAFFFSSIDDYLNEKDFHFSDIVFRHQSSKPLIWEIQAELPPDSDGKYAGLYEYAVTIRKIKKYIGVTNEILTYENPSGLRRPLIHLNEADKKTITEIQTSSLDEPIKTRIGFMRSSIMADMPDFLLESYPELQHFRNWLSGVRSYFLNPNSMRWRYRDTGAELGPYGEHLAPVLSRIKKKDPKAFERINRKMKSIFPSISGISTRGVGWGYQQINQLEPGQKNLVIPSQHMSDGTFRMLALCAFLYSDEAPAIINLEEIENGIHPQLIRDVVQMLRDLTLKKRPCAHQVFITTHNPYVLDEFIDNSQEVYVMERGMAEQGAKLYRLSENKHIDVVKATFKHSLGEAWFSGLIGGAAKGSMQWESGSGL